MKTELAFTQGVACPHWTQGRAGKGCKLRPILNQFKKDKVPLSHCEVLLSVSSPECDIPVFILRRMSFPESQTPGTHPAAEFTLRIVLGLIFNFY